MFRAKIIEIIEETPRVKRLRLTWDSFDTFSFKPGQWVSVWSDNLKDESGNMVRRAFSIASLPNEQFLELCVAKTGLFSTYLHEREVGDSLLVQGPFGVFALKDSEAPVLFVAGGTGIAPFRPMIKQALDVGRTVTLLFSFRTPADFIYERELRSMQNENFSLVISLTGECPPDLVCERGRAQTIVHKFWKSGMDVYVCGPKGMVVAVQEKLEELGQPKEKIFVDKWE